MDTYSPFPWCSADLTANPVVWLINWSLLLCSQAVDVEKLQCCPSYTQKELLSHMCQAHSRLYSKATDSETKMPPKKDLSFSYQEQIAGGEGGKNVQKKRSGAFPLWKVNSSQVRWSSAWGKTLPLSVYDNLLRQREVDVKKSWGQFTIQQLIRVWMQRVHQ